MLFAAFAAASTVALGLSREAQEFIAISKDLEAISRASREAFYRCE